MLPDGNAKNALITGFQVALLRGCNILATGSIVALIHICMCSREEVDISASRGI